MRTFPELLAAISADLPVGGEWCSERKAHALAALVVGLNPRTCVEIGVWRGGSAIPVALALQFNRRTMASDGTLIAIDPWSKEASADGQIPVNAEWWESVDHEDAYRVFCERLARFELVSPRKAERIVEVWRARSDDTRPPTVIDLLHVDGNHAEQATRDIERFCPSVRVGGIAILDDVQWTGGHVETGVDRARAMGFVELYALDKGVVMQRRFGGPA